MMLKLLKPWRRFKAGHVIDPHHNGVADALIRKGFAVAADSAPERRQAQREAPEPMAAVFDAARDAMEPKPRRARKRTTKS